MAPIPRTLWPAPLLQVAQRTGQVFPEVSAVGIQAYRLAESRDGLRGAGKCVEDNAAQIMGLGPARSQAQRGVALGEGAFQGVPAFAAVGLFEMPASFCRDGCCGLGLLGRRGSHGLQVGDGFLEVLPKVLTRGIEAYRLAEGGDGLLEALLLVEDEAAQVMGLRPAGGQAQRGVALVQGVLEQALALIVARPFQVPAGLLAHRRRDLSPGHFCQDGVSGLIASGTHFL